MWFCIKPQIYNASAPDTCVCANVHAVHCARYTLHIVHIVHMLHMVHMVHVLLKSWNPPLHWQGDQGLTPEPVLKINIWMQIFKSCTTEQNTNFWYLLFQLCSLSILKSRLVGWSWFENIHIKNSTSDFTISYWKEYLYSLVYDKNCYLLVSLPNPLAPGSDIQIHVSWGTRLFSTCTCKPPCPPQSQGW